MIACVLASASAVSAAREKDGGRREDGDILVAGNVCASVQHLADAPGVAYVPGVDLHGKAVAAADLPDPGRAEADAFFGSTPVWITRELRRSATRGGRPAFLGLAEIGSVTVSNGQAYIDGRALTPEETQLLGVACRQPRR